MSESSIAYVSILLLIGSMFVSAVYNAIPTQPIVTVQGSQAQVQQTNASTIAQAVNTQLCGFVDNIRTVVGVVSLIMFLFGAVIYGIGHLLPNAGKFKDNAQGWAMNMLMGAILGIILVLAAPFVINAILGIAKLLGGSALSSVTC